MLNEATEENAKNSVMQNNKKGNSLLSSQPALTTHT